MCSGLLFQEKVPNINSVPIKTGYLNVWDWVCLLCLNDLMPSCVQSVESQEAWSNYS